MEFIVFFDVAVFFSVEEWALLESEQKALYQEVMLENKRIIASLGQIFYQLNMGFVVYIAEASYLAPTYNSQVSA
uniref:KRAB domain-containing protein n=1 Tax=Laticauda laticaudata TaxID=8630 RepID=A0A8C5S869_LATLA